ncbi:synapsin-1-like [Rhinolophus ferrumequinum]|uniref:synapsin-1-like n=1 Tax=Rhinolophus ferrumequinum TaxID=59479 RepID=UPI00140FC6C5|nr:synapsin-1-like [Rhinolophus ferrumequinum]
MVTTHPSLGTRRDACVSRRQALTTRQHEGGQQGPEPRLHARLAGRPHLTAGPHEAPPPAGNSDSHRNHRNQCNVEGQLAERPKHWPRRERRAGGAGLSRQRDTRGGTGREWGRVATALPPRPATGFLRARAARTPTARRRPPPAARDAGSHSQEPARRGPSREESGARAPPGTAARSSAAGPRQGAQRTGRRSLRRESRRGRARPSFRCDGASRHLGEPRAPGRTRRRAPRCPPCGQRPARPRPPAPQRRPRAARSRETPPRSPLPAQPLGPESASRAPRRMRGCGSQRPPRSPGAEQTGPRAGSRRPPPARPGSVPAAAVRSGTGPLGGLSRPAEPLEDARPPRAAGAWPGRGPRPAGASNPRWRGLHVPPLRWAPPPRAGPGPDTPAPARPARSLAVSDLARAEMRPGWPRRGGTPCSGRRRFGDPAGRSRRFRGRGQI